MCVIVAQRDYGTLLMISQYVSIWHPAANKNLKLDGTTCRHLNRSYVHIGTAQNVLKQN